MSECFRVDAANELAVYLLTELGPNSTYPTLKIEAAMVKLLRDVQDWERLSIDEQLPLVVVQGRQWTGEMGQHFGEGRTKIDKTHIYTIGALVEGELAVATRDAEILGRRIERALLTKKSITARADDDEYADRIELMSGEFFTAQKRDTATDSWFGICLLTVRLRGMG